MCILCLSITPARAQPSPFSVLSDSPPSGTFPPEPDAIISPGEEMEPSQTLPAPESRPEKKSDKKADKEKDKKTAAEEKTHPAPKPATFNAIRLLGLNKVTARSAVLEAPLGTVMRMGNIEIIARRCWQAPPDAPPENAALLEVRELKPEGPVPLFSGWMFSSSPGLSSLEHPVYDVTVLACVGTEQTD